MSDERKKLLECFDEMWKSATIGDTWKLNEEMQRAHKQIRNLIQQKPKIDKAYVDRKAIGFLLSIFNVSKSVRMNKLKNFIRQIINEAQGKEK